MKIRRSFYLCEGTTARRKSVSSQCEPTRRLRGGHSERESIPSIFRQKREKMAEGSIGSNSLSERRSSEEVSSLGEKERRKERSKVRNLLGVTGRERRGKRQVRMEKERRERGESGRQDEVGEDGEEGWSSSESSGSLLCSLAPAWLTARRRRRKAAAPG